MNLKTLEAKVRLILEEVPRTRESDKELALELWTRYYRINPYAPICDVLRKDNIPSIESIGRCRRRLQEKDESLRGTEREHIRMEVQKNFIEYAKEDTY